MKWIREVDAGCHTDLACYCAIRDKARLLNAELGPGDFALLLRYICGACSIAISSEPWSALSDAGDVSTHLLRRMAEVDKGCHLDLACLCTLSVKLRQLHDTLTDREIEMLFEHVCATCTQLVPVTPPLPPPPKKDDPPVIVVNQLCPMPNPTSYV